MDMLIAIAIYGCVRRPNIRKVHHMAAPTVKDVDRSGLVAMWRLGRHRGYALAFDPDVSLVDPLRRLLIALSLEYPTAIVSDASPLEAKTPPNITSRQYSPELLFGSPLRMKILATLEAMQGRARSALLGHIVPGGFYCSVQTLVRKLKRDGILRQRGTMISFVPYRWLPELRLLLRAFLDQQPDFCEEIERVKRIRNVPRPRHYKLGLFGRGAMERILVVLAAKGPLRFARLMAEATTKSDRALMCLEQDGIVASIRNGYRRTVGLNACHPLYSELVAFLLGASNANRSSNALRVPRHSDHDYGVTSLFSKQLRLDVLLSVAASHKGEIDGKSIGRIHPEYDQGLIFRRLRSFERMGILLSRRWKTLVLYRLNPDHSSHEHLHRLLKRIAIWCPELVAASETEEALYPLQRRAMYTERRQKRKKGRN